MNNTTEYGAGEFPLPTRPRVGSAAQSTTRPLSMIRSQQTEEAYPDLSNLKKELERAQRERHKAIFDRDGAKLEREQANLERDQAILERDQARCDLSIIRAEYQQEQKVREKEANCEQLKLEIEKIQRRQREFARQKEKGTRTTEQATAGSRPESQMEVDEVPRSSGRFNLDRAAQEHMNEGLEVWIPSEPVSSVRGLEAQPIRPLMEVTLPGYTPSSTPGSSQISGGSSRLKELQDRLQLRSHDDSTRQERPSTWSDHPLRSVNEITRQIQQRSVLPGRLLDVADLMERSNPDDASSDGIHFDRPKGLEWLNGVFQRHINALESDLLETAQFTFGPPPMLPFFATGPLSSRLGSRVDSKDSSRSSRTGQTGSTPMEAEEAESSTPQSSVVSSVVVVENKRVERPAEASWAQYLERIKELDLDDLECRQELAKVLGLKDVSHDDWSRHHCVDWLKAHEAHFSRARMMETADLSEIPLKSIMGPINYRPLKLLGSPRLIVEPPRHRTSIARIRVATPAQLILADKLLEPKDMGLPDAAYEGSKLADDPRYGEPCGNSRLAKILAVYDQSDPGAAKVIIVAGSDFEGTSLKLFWPETLVYLLPGAELNQMLTLVVAIKPERTCEPEMLLFAGMNDHLHAVGLLEHQKGDAPIPKKIWEAIQTLFAAMNEVQENVNSRFGSKTKVAFTTSPGYASLPPALQFVYAILILIAKGNACRVWTGADSRSWQRHGRTCLMP